MKSKLSQQAVMNVNEGEEIAGRWSTSNVPGTGIYKLAAKKKKDGMFEWAQFIHREIVMRGETKDQAQLDEVDALTKKNLKNSSVRICSRPAQTCSPWMARRFQIQSIMGRRFAKSPYHNAGGTRAFTSTISNRSGQRGR